MNRNVLLLSRSENACHIPSAMAGSIMTVVTKILKYIISKRKKGKARYPI
jgi:hypothetical protein